MIIVDRPIWHAHDRRWSHLCSDTSFDELHAFAAELGLPARAFHRDHYDLPDVRFDQAVAAGATVVSATELVRALRAAGLRRPRRRH
ncbi:MAG TPA: DUF4031 domain-containing protein [Nitriliruptoraceae bacterium]|nr:DUF4031 domain-containing protein [Nitriliruptoraceae bacterium]